MNIELSNFQKKDNIPFSFTSLLPDLLETCTIIPYTLMHFDKVYYASGLKGDATKCITFVHNCNNGAPGINIDQKNNLDRLYHIKQLPQNWNGYGCEKISEDIIETSENIIKNVLHQPIIYPTGRESIQMQYELKDNSYLEFEIFNDRITCLIVPKRIYDQASFETFSIHDIKHISNIIEDFYAGSNKFR